MNDASEVRPRPVRKAAVRVLIEAVVVAAAGAALAFAANALSPRGLKLSRNYFPGGTNGSVVSPVALPRPVAGSTNSPTPARLLAAQMKKKGLQLMDERQAVRLFRDPRREAQLIVFVDARDERHYREGHVPGAYELDPYRPEKHLAAVLAACQTADIVVVYCNGGECEDSQFAAVLLREAGIPNQRLFVFGGGILEWTAAGLPLEIGRRDSGEIRREPKAAGAGKTGAANPNP